MQWPTQRFRCTLHNVITRVTQEHLQCFLIKLSLYIYMSSIRSKSVCFWEKIQLWLPLDALSHENLYHSSNCTCMKNKICVSYKLTAYVSHTKRMKRTHVSKINIFCTYASNYGLHRHFGQWKTLFAGFWIRHKYSNKFGLSFVLGRNYIITFGPVSVSVEFIKTSSGRYLYLQGNWKIKHNKYGVSVRESSVCELCKCS